MNLNGIQPTTDEAMAFADRWGMPGTAPHYAVGWAWAGDAPFQWTKQVASHFGGTRNSMIVSWPKTIEDTGEVRSQFHHVIDIMPTLMEVVGIKEPTTVHGVPQRPIEGTSMAYTFLAKNADAPSRRESQYFEMLGHRAMYHDGWMASCRHGNLPWETAGTVSFDDDVWELYHLAEDFSQAVDLAAEHPDRLADLQTRFTQAAARYDVLPLDDRFSERADVTLRPSFFAGRESVTFYPGMVRLPEGSAPRLVSVEHTITAPISVPDAGGEGVVVSLGGEAAGWSLFLWEGRARYHYNFFGIERYDARSSETLGAGDHLLRVEVVPDVRAPGVPATARLFVDGQLADEMRIEPRAWTSGWTVCHRSATTTTHAASSRSTVPSTPSRSISPDPIQPREWSVSNSRPRWTEAGRMPGRVRNSEVSAARRSARRRPLRRSRSWCSRALAGAGR
jgi:arylsulfatase